ncbi:MAG TPA: HipA domain-containing protein, partial [Acidimicrobiales bacterium]
KALGLDCDDLREAFRRMVFNVMAVNRDDHTKNFAFTRPEGGAWQLTPAFDVTHAYRPDSPWNSRHLMSINGKFDDIALEDIYAVGERAEVPGYRKIVRDVEQAIAEWADYAAAAALDEGVVKAIASDHERFRPR